MTRIALAPSKMVLLMSLVITGAHASPEQPLIKDTPFVSGQAYKKGFFWYDDPAKKSEAEEEEFCHQPVLLARLQKRKW